MALVSSDYRVYWLADDCVTCICGLTNTGRLDTLAGFKVEATDDFGIGDANLRWSTADANAQELLIDLPAGSSTKVPVLVVGQGCETIDLAFFNGYTETNLAVVDLAKTSWVAFGFSAAGVPRIRAGGSASVIAFNDAGIAVGTVLTTAETKVTVAFDDTLTGIGAFQMGSMSVPQILNVNPGATVVPMVLNVNHTAGTGNMDDYVGFYDKINIIGAGDATLTAVAGAFRAYVGDDASSDAVVAQLYACQPWVKHGGIGAITAMSALSAMCDVQTNAFTGSTVNSGHFHVQGAATVTAQFDGVMIEVYPDVTCLDSGLAIASDSGAVVDSAIRIAGTFVHQIKLSSGAFIMTGTADPNGNVAGTDGSIYLRTGTGAFASVLYVCNTAGTGWDAVAVTP